MKNLIKKIKRLFGNRNQKLDFIITQNQRLIELKENEKVIIPNRALKELVILNC